MDQICTALILACRRVYLVLQSIQIRYLAFRKNVSPYIITKFITTFYQMLTFDTFTITDWTWTLLFEGLWTWWQLFYRWVLYPPDFRVLFFLTLSLECITGSSVVKSRQSNQYKHFIHQKSLISWIREDGGIWKQCGMFIY